MKPAVALRILAGIALAASCAAVPLRRSRAPEPVFVLPHDFAGPYEAEDGASLWLHHADFGSLVRREDGALGPDGADAMVRHFSLLFRPPGARDDALRRLATLRESFAGWGLSFEPVGAAEIRLAVTDPPGDLRELAAAVKAACGADVDFASAEVRVAPRVEARFRMKIRREARLPDESVYPRRITPSVEVRAYLAQLLESNALPPTILEVETVDDDHVAIRTRHSSPAMLRAVGEKCPGVLDSEGLRSESVASRIGGRERVVTLRVRPAFPYATAAALSRLAPFHRALAEFGFAMRTEPPSPDVLVTLVDPPANLGAIEKSIRTFLGRSATLDASPSEVVTRPRTDTRWTVKIVPGARLPDGRVLTTRGLGLSEAVQAYLHRLPRAGALAAMVVPVQLLDEERVEIVCRRPGRDFLDALAQACPGVFDLKGSEIEQALVLRAVRPGGDPALVADFEATLSAIRRHGSPRYAPLVRGTETEVRTVLRVGDRARFADGRPMAAEEAAKYLELLVRLQFSVVGVLGMRPRLAELGGVPANAGALDRSLSALGDLAAIALPVRVLGAGRVAVVERRVSFGFLRALSQVCPGFFVPERTEIVLRTPRLDFSVLEACVVPLAGAQARADALRETAAGRFRIVRADEIGDVETALREGRASAAFVPQPPEDLPAVDLGLHGILAGVFNCARPSLSRAATRQAVAWAARGRPVRLRDMELRVLSRRHCRASRDQALLVAERLREAGARPALETVDDASFLNRLSSGEFDIAVDVFPETMRAEPRRWWRSGGGRNVARYSSPELDARLDRLNETFAGTARAELEFWVRCHLDSEAPWVVFDERVPIRLCGSREALRLLAAGR
ncbi:MAG: hypothetical protein HYY17_04145 [Planctomycetes bacterium]|nr:hypothetical protein [Planctomycetota bacterium]